MSENFRMNDVNRQRIEKEALAKKEAETRVVRAVENTFVKQLFDAYGNGKLYEVSQPNLERIEGTSTGTYAFNGKVQVSANVTDSSGLKQFKAEIPVKSSVVELLDIDDLKKIINDTEVQSPPETFDVSAESIPLKADLGNFRVVDDGSEYLKVYHNALDLGKELGVFHKEEYEKMDDKEASFKEILENQITHSAIESYHTLEFEGSFVEPQIEVRADETVLTSSDYKKCLNCNEQLDDCTCDPSQTEDDPKKHSVEAEAEEDVSLEATTDEIVDNDFYDYFYLSDIYDYIIV